MWPTLEFTDNATNLLLLNLLIQVSLLLSLILFAGKLLQKNATGRYSVLYTGMLALPALLLFSIALQFSGNALLNLEIPAAQNPTAMAPGPDLQLEEFSMEASAPFALDRQSSQSTLADVSLSGEASEATGARLPVAMLALLTWLGGFLLGLSGLLRSLHKMGRLASESAQLSAGQSRTLQTISEELGHPASLQIRISTSVPGPVLAGITEPVLLVPPTLLSELDRQQIKDILIHELAHVRRKDSRANLLQKFILALFWFHPLAHLLNRAIDRAREEICDNHVLQSSKPYRYGETLLAVQSLHSATGQTGRVALAHPMTLGISSLHWKLEQRIEELLDSSRSLSVKLSNRNHSLIVAATSIISLFLAGCQLQAAENQSPQQRIAELELQAQELNQQRAALEQQTRELEEQLRRSAREQEQNNSNYRYRQQVLRSVNEIRSLLQAGNQANQFEDVAELTRRILEEISVATRAQGAITLSAEALMELNELIAALDADSLNREQLLAEISSLSTMLDITSRASNPQPVTNPRPTPRARDREILGQDVYEQIVQIQELMSPADDRQEPDWESAKRRLDRLMESSFGEMNRFEKTTTLSFYSNYWLAHQNYAEAIGVFEHILQIEDQRSDIRLRALRSLGQLYAAEERWQESLDNYAAWNELSDREDSVVLRGLSYGHYQLQEYTNALDYWEQFMAHSRASGENLDREKYAYLNGLYYQLGMHEEALANTKEMLVLFNDATDWRNLRTLYAELGMLDAMEFDDAELDNSTADLNIPVSIDYTPFITPLDGEYLPLVAIAPQYPSAAAQNGVEGWVLVSFTVDEEGGVIEDSIDVVDADPPQVFNRSSMRAAARFKFQPRVTDGVGVPVSGVQYLFRYRLRDDA
jgi:TonB family protein